MHVRVLTKICMVRSVLSRAPAEEGLAAAWRSVKCEIVSAYGEARAVGQNIETDH